MTRRRAMAMWLIWCAITVAFCAALILPFVVRAHGAADWIQRGDYRNPVTKERCCGVNDCERIPADRVTMFGQGFYDVDGKTIPLNQVLPSEDDQWWVCWRPELPYRRSRSIRCIFAPLRG